VQCLRIALCAGSSFRAVLATLDESIQARNGMVALQARTPSDRKDAEGAAVIFLWAGAA